MKKCCRYFRIRFSGEAVTCVIAMVVVGLIGTRPAIAQVPAVSSESDGAGLASTTSKVQVMDLRDAPVRRALVMLLHNIGRARFSIDNLATGYVTAKGTDQTIVQALDLLCSSAEVPLTLTVEGWTYFIRASPSKDPVITPKRRNPMATTATAPTTVRRVPRRVAGVLILEDGHSYAILETGVPYGSSTTVSLVETGGGRVDLTHVPSGVRGVPDLTLAAIDATGVTLTAIDGSTIRVPLASTPAVSAK